MDSQRWERIRELYHAALELEPAERQVLFADAEAEDPSIAAELQDLLASDSRAGSFLELPSSARGSSWFTAPEPPPAGTHIGGYTIQGILGHGGMGVVYEAEQDCPRRTVALKVMRALPYLDELTPRLFHREGQALARLAHPGVAAIHEAGCSPEGWYYFAMERVAGTALTDYVRDHQLSPRDTLELFRRVCDAVHYAHQRGVIHRDLKPSNILVTADGQPKVLDFGLARIVEPGADYTDLTEPGVFQGTLAYASPEQAEGQPGKIDVRTDVYSLGVILYQLLTGKFPYDVTGGLRDVLDRILRAEPVRPSMVAKQIDDEVETIVLKCLHKERDRRYQSAADLADDIRHYLAGEPIEAKGDSAMYVLRKTLGRYRVPVAFGAALLVTLTIALAIALVAQHRAAQERDRALVAEQRKQRVLACLTDVFGSANPLSGRRTAGGSSAGTRTFYAGQDGEIATVVDLLQEAVRRLDEAELDPFVEAELRYVLGKTLAESGQFEPAVTQLQKAVALQGTQLGPQAEATLASVERLTYALFQSGHTVEALALARPNYESVRAARGPADVMTRTFATHVARALAADGRFEAAVGFLRELSSAAAAAREEYDEQVVELRFELASAFSDIGRAAESLAINRDVMRVLALRPQSRLLYLRAAEGAADALYDLGCYREAAEASRAVVDGYIAEYGEDHPFTAYQMVYLARSLGEADQLTEARDVAEKALACHQRFSGDENLDTYRAERCLARILARLDTDLERAEDLARHALAGYERAFQPGHFNNLYARDVLAVVLQHRGRLDEAEDAFRQNVAEASGSREILIRTRASLGLGMCLAQRRKYAEAETYFLAAADSAEQTTGLDSDLAHQVASAMLSFYQEWNAAAPECGYALKAADWRAKLAALRATVRRATESGSEVESVFQP
ncbi:MAG: serine/threonine protein kinase [Phycisphaerae bacterium]|nr:serine/threonine protein kinase [Phycisphaerae bacterium]